MELNDKMLVIFWVECGRNSCGFLRYYPRIFMKESRTSVNITVS
jgi:hypothetical protein